MILLNELNEWIDVVRFALWAVVVFAVGGAIFRSWFAEELKRLSIFRPTLEAEIKILQWEIGTQSEYNEEIRQKGSMAKARKLSSEEIEERKRKLETLRRDTVGIRAMRYFLGCVFCQSFWVALGLALSASRWENFWSDVVLSAFAYAGAIALAISAFGKKVGGCGGKR